MITLDCLAARYDENDVLYDVSLSIRPGEFIALIGPNGSGKSTLIKILAGQLLPSAGKICLGDRDLSVFGSKERGFRIAYFPQIRPIPNMDVQTLVSHGRFPRLNFGRVLGEKDHMAVTVALARTGLESMRKRPLSTLSGGERQRAYLAMLIAQDAEILLLDEPGSFLDIRHQLEIMDILQELNQQGKTIIFAAHDLPLAFSYAGRICLIKKGYIIADTTPDFMAGEPVIEQAFGVRLRPENEDSLFKYILADVKKQKHYSKADAP